MLLLTVNSTHSKKLFKKKWSQNGSTVELFGKTLMDSLRDSQAIGYIVAVPRYMQSPLDELGPLCKAVPKWGTSCGHENGSTLEPFRLHFFLSVLVSDQFHDEEVKLLHALQNITHRTSYQRTKRFPDKRLASSMSPLNMDPDPQVHPGPASPS